jgi:hypothetical protein
MSLFDKILKIGEYLIAAGQQKQIEMQKKAASRIREYERKIEQAERSDKMNNPEYASRVQLAKQRLEQAKINVYTGGKSNVNLSFNENGQLIVKGKSVDEWDRQWQFIARLSEMELSHLKPYNKSIGLYKAVMNGEIVYIGRAIEYANGGFRKRLRDYIRESNSARKHRSGQKMHEHADYLDIYFLVVGNSVEDVKHIKILEAALIRKHQPKWNVQLKK